MFLVCGEALLDLFVPAGPPGAGPLAIEGVPGGSPFNVAIGLARLGVETGFLGGLSDDALGDLLAGRLAREGVSLAYAVRRPERTTLSLVSLRADGSPAYAFYGPGAEAALAPADLPPLGPEIVGLHLGSYTTVVPPVADALASLVARMRGRLVTLDLNVRPTVEPDLARWRARLEGLLPSIGVLKASEEDLALLWPGRTATDLAGEWLSRGPGLVVITRGGAGAEVYRSGAQSLSAAAPVLDVVDTVGAGDAFQSALIDGLLAHGVRRQGDVETLPSDIVAAIVSRSVLAGAIACTRRGASPPGVAELIRVGMVHG